MSFRGERLIVAINVVVHHLSHSRFMICQECVIDGALYGATGDNEGEFLTCTDFQTGKLL